MPDSQVGQAFEEDDEIECRSDTEPSLLQECTIGIKAETGRFPGMHEIHAKAADHKKKVYTTPPQIEYADNVYACWTDGNKF